MMREKEKSKESCRIHDLRPTFNKTNAARWSHPNMKDIIRLICYQMIS